MANHIHLRQATFTHVPPPSKLVTLRPSGAMKSCRSSASVNKLINTCVTGKALAGKRVRRSESRHEIESGLGSTTRISRSRGASDLKPKLSMFYGIGHSHCRSLINTCNRPPSPFTQRRETESHLMAATSSRCLSMNDSLRGSCPTTTIQDPSSHRSKLPRKWVTQLPWLVFAIVINLTA